tara:strand:+ start:592 stop:1053 length:462 start_codon:yes stop_codon:yes gene_type:complete
MSKDKKKKLITKRQCNEKICATIDEVFNNRIDTIFCKIEEKVEIYYKPKHYQKAFNKSTGKDYNYNKLDGIVLYERLVDIILFLRRIPLKGPKLVLSAKNQKIRDNYNRVIQEEKDRKNNIAVDIWNKEHKSNIVGVSNELQEMARQIILSID